MQIVISSGHGKNVRGASGYLDEVNEARRVVERVAELWRKAGVGVKTFHDNTSTSQNQNLTTIVNYHNSQTRDLDVSIHFNAYQTTNKPMGTETLYVTQETLASTVSKKIAAAGGFINRGSKYRSDLYFLNNTRMPSVLIEVCFVDSSADAELYRKNFDAICTAIAEGLTGIEIGEPVEPPDVDRPPIERPPEAGENNRVDITASTTGNVVIVLNGEEFVHGERTDNRLVMTLRIEGSVAVTINGQDYHGVEDQRPDKNKVQENIKCSVFGGDDDPNDSAYPPYDHITDQEVSCALPWRFEEPRPLVRVLNLETKTEIVCQIRDIGPWMTDDDYWSKGSRPMAEISYETNTPLPYGPNAGKVANGAGIDITPAAARAIGLQGMGTVHWAFLRDDKKQNLS